MGYFEPKKVDTYLSKFSHHASFHEIWSTANWVFFCWLVCHLTPMLLMVSKQGWCHFEALECIFHLNLKKIPSVNQLTHNQQNTAFPNIWLTLYVVHRLNEAFVSIFIEIHEFWWCRRLFSGSKRVAALKVGKTFSKCTQKIERFVMVSC